MQVKCLVIYIELRGSLFYEAKSILAQIQETGLNEFYAIGFSNRLTLNIKTMNSNFSFGLILK